MNWGEVDPDLDLRNISSFAEDADGNLYIIELDGNIFRLASVPEPSSAIVLLAVGGLMMNRRKR